MRNIFLIGFMGCGKSTVAVELQNLYRMQVREMDQMIVDRAQMSIPQIFEKYGEGFWGQNFVFRRGAACGKG